MKRPLAIVAAFLFIVDLVDARPSDGIEGQQNSKKRAHVKLW